MKKRTCPNCSQTTVIEDGYCGHCRQCVLWPLKAKHQYLFVEILESRSEISTTFPVVKRIGIKSNPKNCAQLIAADWFHGDGSRVKVEDSYDFDCGAVGIQVESFQVIPKEDFDVLSRYITNLSPKSKE